MIAAKRSFDSDQHIYRSERGRLPGATDIIKSEGLINSEWMSEEVRWRGKAVHHGIKLINKGTLDEESVDDEIRGYLDSYRLFLKTTRFAVIGYEEPIFDDAFATIPDIWGVLNGVQCLIELKSGPIPKWAALQTALQARALWTDKKFRAYKRFGLKLCKDGRMSNLLPFENRGDDYAAMSMVTTFHWKKDNGYIPDWRR